MKLPKINKADLLSYARHTVIALGVAIAATEKATGKTPLEYTKTEWLFMANTLWVGAIMPAIKKWWKRYSAVSAAKKN